MYSTADVIYGIPITRMMDRWLQEHYDDEDVQTEEFEVLGFEVQYSGNADHQCGFLGVALGGMDVVNPVELLRDDENRIVGMRVVKGALGPDVIDFDLRPTVQQVQETIEKHNELPDGLKAICPPIGIHIVWSTS